MLVSNVNLGGHELDVRSLPRVGDIMSLTLLIPSGLSSLVRAGSLPHLPSLDHGELFRDFPMRIFPGKKILLGNVVFVKSWLAPYLKSQECLP